MADQKVPTKEELLAQRIGGSSAPQPYGITSIECGFCGATIAPIMPKA